jgi:hypothetical protein
LQGVRLTIIGERLQMPIDGRKANDLALSAEFGEHRLRASEALGRSELIAHESALTGGPLPSSAVQCRGQRAHLPFAMASSTWHSIIIVTIAS